MEKLTKELQLLRQVVTHLETSPPPIGTMTKANVDRSPFLKTQLTPSGTIGITTRARTALYELAESFFENSRRIQRGAPFGALYNELANVIIRHFFDRNVADLALADVELVAQQIDAWFNAAVAPEEIYVPCCITPRVAAAFSIGPVRFTYIDEFVRQQRVREGEEFDGAFGHLITSMEQTKVFWVATVTVDGCIDSRVWELGELAVDLALVGVQLVVPYENELMVRMNGRTKPRDRFTVSRRDGALKVGAASQIAGRSVGKGLLEQLLSQKREVLDAVGRRIDAFLSQSAALGRLEQAWADAAYWFHEALAESVDTIAVSKFETAIEVLMRAESSSGSKRRIMQALDTFYGLSENQPINASSQTTVKQFAKRVAGDRAQVLHGTWSTLNHSLREARPDMEVFTGSLLANYLIALELYSGTPLASDNLDEFLRFTKGYLINKQSLGHAAAASPNG